MEITAREMFALATKKHKPKSTRNNPEINWTFENLLEEIYDAALERKFELTHYFDSSVKENHEIIIKKLVERGFSATIEKRDVVSYCYDSKGGVIFEEYYLKVSW